MLPVVEAGSLHLPFGERKAKGLDEVESGSGREACAARISGVPVNFGMYKYYVCCQMPSPAADYADGADPVT